MVWFWFYDTQLKTALCKKVNGIYIENKLVELNLDNTEASNVHNLAIISAKVEL